MPTYDYQCRACGSVTEVIHSMLDDGPSVCVQCGGPLRRVLYPTGIIFKGSGFYRTDSRAATGSGGDSNSGSSSGGTTESGTTSTSDTPRVPTTGTSGAKDAGGGSSTDGGSTTKEPSS